MYHTSDILLLMYYDYDCQQQTIRINVHMDFFLVRLNLNRVSNILNITHTHEE